MINENTLKTLNKIAFGADIDSLESHLVDLKQAELISDITNYEYNYLKLTKMLKEIKPSSLLFTDKTSLEELKFNDYDKYFSLSSEQSKIIYGTSDSNLSIIKNDIEEPIDIVAINNVDGININCVYINGYLYRIYGIGKYNKYINLTEQLKDKLPGYIEEISNLDIVEFRGKVTIFNTHKKLQYSSLNLIASTMRCIRTNSNIGRLDIVLNDMYTDISELNIDNQWDKLQFMRDIGLSVPHHALIRNIDKEILSQALEELDVYFEDIKTNEGINYSYTGFEVRKNKNALKDNSSLNIIYDSRTSKPGEIYKSTIKSISTIYKDNIIESIVNIIPIQCNNNLVINKIEIDDIYNIEKYSLHIGNKVYFQVIEGEALLVNID